MRNKFCCHYSWKRDTYRKRNEAKKQRNSTKNEATKIIRRNREILEILTIG